MGTLALHANRALLLALAIKAGAKQATNLLNILALHGNQASVAAFVRLEGGRSRHQRPAVSHNKHGAARLARRMVALRTASRWKYLLALYILGQSPRLGCVLVATTRMGPN